MTNNQMVIQTAIFEGLYTEGQAAALLKANGGTLPLYTFKEWKRRGYIVKKGQHAALTMLLWSFVGAGKAEEAPADADGEAEEKARFRLRKIHLFDFRQVEKLAAADAV